MLGGHPHLKIQFGGLGLHIPLGTSLFEAPLPKKLLVIGILVADLPVQSGNQFQIAGRMGGDAVRKAGQMRPVFANPTFAMHLNPNSILGSEFKIPVQHAALHVQGSSVRFRGPCGQVNPTAVHRPIQVQPIGGVQNLGEILRVTVFPPPYPGFVRIINPCHVGALKGMTRIGLFMHGPLAKKTIAKAKHALGSFMQSSVPTFLGYQPRVQTKHCFTHRIYISKKNVPLIQG